MIGVVMDTLLRMIQTSKCLAIICLALVFGSVGCVSPEDRFIQTGAQAFDSSEGFGGVAFGAMVDGKFIEGEQYIFKVRLMDEKARPIKSRNGAYQDERGNVAAQKSIMIHKGSIGAERVEVRIPANELELRSNDFPIWIGYGLIHPDGSVFSEVYRPLPRNTQSIVQRYVTATYGEQPREPKPRRTVRRRTIRRPTRSRSELWRPSSQTQGPGFCPQHGVSCNCALRQDVPAEYMRSSPRPSSRSRRSSEATRTRPRSSRSRRYGRDPR